MGSPEGGRAVGNLCLLAALSLGALLGVRRAEVNERRIFLSGVRREVPTMESEFDEGSNDFPEEFEPSAPLMQWAGDEHADETVSMRSVPSTTLTGKLFTELEREDLEPRWKLERIAEIGRKEIALWDG